MNNRDHINENATMGELLNSPPKNDAPACAVCGFVPAIWFQRDVRNRDSGYCTSCALDMLKQTSSRTSWTRWAMTSSAEQTERRPQRGYIVGGAQNHNLMI